MSQRLLIILLSIALVASVGVSTAINSALTAQLVANATIAGPAGPAGADGVDGSDGRDGVDGAVGATGATGPAGPTGPSGSAVRGAAGAAGPSGSPGLPGPQGTPGLDAPPVVTYSTSTGSSTGTLFTWGVWTPVPDSSLIVPTGVYALTTEYTDALSVLTGFGYSTTVECRFFKDGVISSLGQQFIESDGLSRAYVSSDVMTLSVDTTIDLRCVGPVITSATFSWTDIGIEAVRLD